MYYFLYARCFQKYRATWPHYNKDDHKHNLEINASEHILWHQNEQNMESFP